MKLLFVAALVLLVIFCIIVGPLLGIWALNTLFILSIPYTLKTWFAAFIVGLYLTASNTTKNSK